MFARAHLPSSRPAAQTAPPRSGHQSGTAAAAAPPASRCWASRAPSPQVSASKRSCGHGASSLRCGWWTWWRGAEGVPLEVGAAGEAVGELDV